MSKSDDSVTNYTEYYENLLHSLQHDHTRQNHERHVLVIEKWCRTFRQGCAHIPLISQYLCFVRIFIKDLGYVSKLLNILQERLTENVELFEDATVKVLRTCGKVLQYCVYK